MWLFWRNDRLGLCVGPVSAAMPCQCGRHKGEDERDARSDHGRPRLSLGKHIRPTSDTAQGYAERRRPMARGQSRDHHHVRRQHCEKHHPKRPRDAVVQRNAVTPDTRLATGYEPGDPPAHKQHDKGAERNPPEARFIERSSSRRAPRPHLALPARVSYRCDHRGVVSLSPQFEPSRHRPASQASSTRSVAVPGCQTGTGFVGVTAYEQVAAPAEDGVRATQQPCSTDHLPWKHKSTVAELLHLEPPTAAAGQWRP